MRDQTGVQDPTVTVSHTTTDQSFGFGSMRLVSGTVQDGTWERSVTIPQGSATGQWKVTLYPLSDTLGNRSTSFQTLATLTVTGTDNPTPVSVVPGAVVFFDGEGTKDDSYTVPSTDGVEYLVDGRVAAAGKYPGTGILTVTARATAGYVIVAGANTEWTTTFSNAEAPYAPPVVSPFADIATNQQFYKEMAWLSEQGISTGWAEANGTRTYRALQPVNRDAMAAFLYRASTPAPVL
ncbi:UNVERIFIED_ORG: hypothetical protein ABIB19_003817 [Arthrobacter sp. UYEF10]